MGRRRGEERGEASERGGEIDARSAREFLQRGWAESEALEREHWARRHREEGPKAMLDAAAALFEHVRRLRPDWPGEEERAADLAHHVAWRRLLETVARGLAAR
jgi:type VI protein secretion system component VasF